MTTEQILTALINNIIFQCKDDGLIASDINIKLSDLLKKK
jgi:hypothetical protein